MIDFDVIQKLDLDFVVGQVKKVPPKTWGTVFKVLSVGMGVFGFLSLPSSLIAAGIFWIASHDFYKLGLVFQGTIKQQLLNSVCDMFEEFVGEFTGNVLEGKLEIAKKHLISVKVYDFLSEVGTAATTLVTNYNNKGVDGK